MYKHEPPGLTQFFRPYKFYGLHEKTKKRKNLLSCNEQISQLSRSFFFDGTPPGGPVGDHRKKKSFETSHCLET